MKRLAYDLRANHRTGVFRFARSILTELALKVVRSARLYVLHSPEDGESTLAELLATLPGKGTQLVCVPDPPGFTRTSPWLRQWLETESIDLYYTVNYIVDLQIRVPYIYTIHDLVRLKHPDRSYTDSTFRARFGDQEFQRIQHALASLGHNSSEISNSDTFCAYFSAINRYQVQHSAHVVTVSEYCRSDIVSLLGAPPEKVSVVPNAVDRAIFYPRTRSAVDEVRHRLGVPPSYCIYVGLAHPHKRVPWLLEVWADTVDRSPSEASLVLVCSDWRARNHLEDIVGWLGLTTRVCLLDPVSDEDLARLYSGARALVVPSMHEGYCLPAHEALACGTEVLVPDLASIRETLGESGHYYQPNSSDTLSHLLVVASMGQLENKADRYRSGDCWERSAAKLFDTIRSCW